MPLKKNSESLCKTHIKVFMLLLKEMNQNTQLQSPRRFLTQFDAKMSPENTEKLPPFTLSVHMSENKFSDK